MKAVKEELDRMERMGVISRVTKPTDWVFRDGSCSKEEWQSTNLR